MAKPIETKIRRVERGFARLAGWGLTLVGVIILVSPNQASIWFGAEPQSDVIPAGLIIGLNVGSLVVAAAYAALFANRGPYMLLVIGGICALGVTNRFASIVADRFGAREEIHFAALLLLMFAMLAFCSVLSELVLRHLERRATVSEAD